MNFYYNGHVYEEKKVNYNPDGTVRNVIYRDNPKVLFIFGCLACLFGLFIIALSIFFVFDDSVKNKTFIQVTGKVVGVGKKQSEDSLEYAPIIEYIVDGKKYKYLSFYSSKKPILNKKVTIKYNPDNPEDIILKDEPDYMILIVAGIVILLIGICVFRSATKAINERKNRKLNLLYSNNLEEVYSEVNYNPDETVKSETYVKKRKLSYLECFIGGIVFIHMGFLVDKMFYMNNNINYNKKNETFIETTATIVDFESREHICSSNEACTDPDSFVEYAPILEYKIDGKVYRYKYNYIREKPTMNDTIDIKYNPNNYSDIIIKNYPDKINMSINMSIVFILIGILLIVIGCINMRKQKSQRNKEIQS